MESDQRPLPQVKKMWLWLPFPSGDHAGYWGSLGGGLLNAGFGVRSAKPCFQSLRVGFPKLCGRTFPDPRKPPRQERGSEGPHYSVAPSSRPLGKPHCIRSTWASRTWPTAQCWVPGLVPCWACGPYVGVQVGALPGRQAEAVTWPREAEAGRGREHCWMLRAVCAVERLSLSPQRRWPEEAVSALSLAPEPERGRRSGNEKITSFPALLVIPRCFLLTTCLRRKEND